ncbi:hypothetical protein [Streptomyces sp. bgisy031]|uniref:hypothetical protein n=1 Tax=Streptomyces sp. bgisy031 TaxID=3413772 RepID=UPI003D71AB2C
MTSRSRSQRAGLRPKACQLTSEKGLPQQLTKQPLEPAPKGEITELDKAAHKKQTNKTTTPYSHVHPLCNSELGTMKPDRHGAELLLQTLTEREDNNSIAIA